MLHHLADESAVETGELTFLYILLVFWAICLFSIIICLLPRMGTHMHAHSCCVCSVEDTGGHAGHCLPH